VKKSGKRQKIRRQEIRRQETGEKLKPET